MSAQHIYKKREGSGARSVPMPSSQMVTTDFPVYVYSKLNLIAKPENQCGRSWKPLSALPENFFGRSSWNLLPIFRFFRLVSCCDRVVKLCTGNINLHLLHYEFNAADISATWQRWHESRILKRTSMLKRTPPMGAPKQVATPTAQAAASISVCRDSFSNLPCK